MKVHTDDRDRVMQNRSGDERWAFDEEVTRVFDDMLARSIPQYEVMRNVVDHAARRILRTNKGQRLVLDLGCSRGAQLASLREWITDCDFVGVEVSEPMAQAASERFAGDAAVTIEQLDLRYSWPALPREVDVTLMVLALQFIPIEHRAKILAKAYQATRPGGAIILVEKLIGRTAQLDDLMVDSYWALKRRKGYSQEEIDRKALSLEGVLVPLTERGNIELLEGAGYTEVECLWRWMNFAAWVGFRR